MGILQVLVQAGLTLKEQANWIAVFDERQEFRDVFGTNRVGKVKGKHFYITPAMMAASAGLLIKGCGYELLHLPSTSGTRKALYPGFDTANRSDEELCIYVTHLREAIDIRMSSVTGTAHSTYAALLWKVLQREGQQHHRTDPDGEELAPLAFVNAQPATSTECLNDRKAVKGR